MRTWPGPVAMIRCTGTTATEVFLEYEAYVFDIHRQPNDHIAFGFGSHFCLGNNLARLEITTFLDRLLTRLPDLNLASPAEPRYRAANFVSGYESMPVTFTPSAPQLGL